MAYDGESYGAGVTLASQGTPGTAVSGATWPHRRYLLAGVTAGGAYLAPRWSDSVAWPGPEATPATTLQLATVT